MKKLLIALIIFISTNCIIAQTITLRIISPKYGHVENISYVCDNDEFSELFYKELQKYYNLDQTGIKPDAIIKISAKVWANTTQIKQGKDITVNIKGAGTLYRTVKPVFLHSQFLIYKIQVNNEVFPNSEIPYSVDLAEEKNNNPTPAMKTSAGYKTTMIVFAGYDKEKVLVSFRNNCPLIPTMLTCQANSADLLKNITEFNITEAIKQGQDINGQFGDEKKSLLMWAIEKDNAAMFEKIVAYKPNLEQKNKNGWTAYMYAKIFVRENMAKRLAALGVETSLTDNTGKNIEELAISLNAKSLMIAAIQNKDIPMIKNLLGKGVKITNDNKDKEEYLKSAIYTDDVAIIKLIVDQGIPLNTKFNNIESVSDVAANYRCFVALNYFLENNIPIQPLKYNSKWLLPAYKDGFKDLVLKMLSTNKDDTENFSSLLGEIIDKKDHDFAEKLMLLPQKQTFNLESMGNCFALLEPAQVEKYLTGFVYEPIKTDHAFRYLINKSLYKGNMKLYYWYLSDSGFKFLTKYNTPSEIALLQKNGDQMKCIDPDPVICMESFKKWPQYINYLDLLMIIPLDYFIEKGYDDMVEYLVNNGADVNRVSRALREGLKTYGKYNCPSFSVLDYAIKFGNEDVIAVLQKNGAKSWKADKHNLFVEAVLENYDSLLSLVNLYKLPDFIATDSVIIKQERYKDIVIVPGQSFFLLLREKAYDSKVQKILIKLFDYGYKLEDKPEDPILNKFVGLYTDYDIVNRLINDGAIVDHPYYIENGEKSPLYKMAIGYGWQNEKTLELLLKNGAKLDTKIKSTGTTIRKTILKEAKYGDWEKVIKLLKKY